jgi:hypothetical protein
MSGEKWQKQYDRFQHQLNLQTDLIDKASHMNLSEPFWVDLGGFQWVRFVTAMVGEDNRLALPQRDSWGI